MIHEYIVKISVKLYLNYIIQNQNNYTIHFSFQKYTR